MMVIMHACVAVVYMRIVLGIDATFDRVVPRIHKSPAHRREAVGMLREEYTKLPSHHRARFMTPGELMDPLEFRAIDPIPDNSALIDEVNYLRSFAVEECRELVCSSQGRKRFAACADSLLSSSKQCQPGCQDHLNMWILHRCYMIETFDCAGNIGRNSVNPEQSVFNQGGPQTLAQFQEGITTLFASKGVNCECCDVSDVILLQNSSNSPGTIVTIFLIAIILLISG